jgi:hypothetical protein
VEGCVRTFEQGAKLHVAFEGTTSIPARCREIDRIAKRFIRAFRDSLSANAKRDGKANVTAAINQLSTRVNEIAARSKQRILQGALDREATEIAPSSRSELATQPRIKPRIPAEKQAKCGKIRSRWLDGQCSQKQWTSDLDIAHMGGRATTRSDAIAPARQARATPMFEACLPRLLAASFQKFPNKSSLTNSAPLQAVSERSQTS